MLRWTKEQRNRYVGALESFPTSVRIGIIDQMMRIKGIRAFVLVVLAGFVAILLQPGRTAAVESLPTEISDATFWQMISDLSEPTDGDTYNGGNNFTSNETTFQEVIPDLLKTTKPGGVYLGVAPEQNFTYIAALQPKISFIIDIRRQNM